MTKGNNQLSDELNEQIREVCFEAVKDALNSYSKTIDNLIDFKLEKLETYSSEENIKLEIIKKLIGE